MQELNLALSGLTLDGRKVDCHPCHLSLPGYHLMVGNWDTVCNLEDDTFHHLQGAGLIAKADSLGGKVWQVGLLACHTTSCSLQLASADVASALSALALLSSFPNTMHSGQFGWKAKLSIFESVDFIDAWHDNHGCDLRAPDGFMCPGPTVLCYGLEYSTQRLWPWSIACAMAMTYNTCYGHDI